MAHPDEFLDDEETDEQRELRLARLSNNTPADDRTLALRVLRDQVDNPRAKPQDRQAAAVALLKAANEQAGRADPAALMAYDLTDAELLDVIHRARERREGLRAQDTSPAAPAPEAQTPRAQDVPRGTSAPTGLMAALAGIADVDVLCL